MINKRTFLKVSAAAALTPLLPFKIPRSLNVNVVEEIADKYLPAVHKCHPDHERENYRQLLGYDGSSYTLQKIGVTNESHLIDLINNNLPQILKEEQELIQRSKKREHEFVGISFAAGEDFRTSYWLNKFVTVRKGIYFMHCGLIRGCMHKIA